MSKFTFVIGEPEDGVVYHVYLWIKWRTINWGIFREMKT